MNKNNKKTIYFTNESRVMMDFLKTTKEYYKMSDSQIISKCIKFCTDILYDKTIKEKSERIKKEELIKRFGSEEELKELIKLNWLDD